MKRKTKYKSAPLNILVAVICLSVCAGSLWFFFDDLNSSSSRTDKDAVARITFKYKIAQRKFSDRVVWERLKQESPLYDGDTVRTADLAFATIHFNEGTQIEINENTMLQINVSKNGEVKLSVSDGQIEVDTTNSSNSVELEMGSGIMVNLESGSKLSAKLDDSKTGVGLNMKAGNAQIQTDESNSPDGNVLNTTLSAGESVKVAESGNITKTPITITSLSETQRILVFEENKKDASAPLEWFPLSNDSEKVIVQTSYTKDFSKIKDSITVEDTNKINIPADDGAVYWRVFPENSEDSSVEGKLLFETVPKVIANSPEKSEEFNYYGEKPLINFMWQGNSYASKYKIEIGTRPNLANPEFVQEVAAQNVSFPNLGEGTYYWRVTPYYEINRVGWYGETEINSFTVAKRDSLLPPTLFIPTDGKKFTYTDNVFDADFSWKGEKINSEYVLQIARDEDFSDVVLNLQTKSKSIHKSLPVTDFPDGDYFWKVTQKVAISETESENLVSAARKFTVAKFMPEQNKLLYPDDSYSVEKSNLESLNFLWKISAENENLYSNEKTMLQFSTSENFSRPILEEAASASSLKNIKLDSGKYFWRVTKGASTTEPRTIFVLDKLQSPKVLSPRPDSKQIFNKGQNLVARWEKVSDADFYKVKLLDLETDKIISEISEVKSESFTFPLEMISNKEQKFKIEVQAITNETKLSASRRSEISESNFSARLASLLRLVSPAPNTKIDGLSALKDGVSLSWSRGEDAYSSATLNLWRVGAGGQLRLIESYKNPRENVNVPRLPEGTYRWTISAQTKEGVSLDAENTRDFTITSVPLLDSPALNMPSRNQVFDAAYLRKNRSITFNWRPVNDATDYTFELYQKLPNGNLKKIHSSENQKSTQVRIRDLTILDVGTFQWQVTAQNRAKDGFVYQNGRTSSQEFKIDFSLTKKVEIVDPGEMYGE